MCNFKYTGIFRHLIILIISITACFLLLSGAIREETVWIQVLPGWLFGAFIAILLCVSGKFKSLYVNTPFWLCTLPGFFFTAITGFRLFWEVPNQYVKELGLFRLLFVPRSYLLMGGIEHFESPPYITSDPLRIVLAHTDPDGKWPIGIIFGAISEFFFGFAIICSIYSAFIAYRQHKGWTYFITSKRYLFGFILPVILSAFDLIWCFFHRIKLPQLMKGSQLFFILIPTIFVLLCSWGIFGIIGAQMNVNRVLISVLIIVLLGFGLWELHKPIITKLFYGDFNNIWCFRENYYIFIGFLLAMILTPKKKQSTG